MVGVVLEAGAEFVFFGGHNLAESALLPAPLKTCGGLAVVESVLRRCLLGLLLMICCTLSCRQRQASAEEERFARALHRSLLPVSAPTTVSEFRLHTGEQQLTTRDLMGHWTLLFFGYMSCPDVCPQTLGIVGQALELLEQQGADVPQLRALFVSVDPNRDTPSRLAAFGHYYHPAVDAATGERSQIDALVQSVQSSYEIPAGATGHYAVGHSPSLFVLDPAAHWVATFPHPESAKQIVRDFLVLEKQRNPMRAHGAWITSAPPEAPVLGGFLSLENRSERPITLTGVTSPSFGAIELHATQRVEGRARMVKLERIVINASESVQLRPGGTHLMLWERKHPLPPDAEIALKLHFSNGLDIDTQAVVADRRTRQQDR